ncbi:AraC family transcriptional regulator [Peribacillus sp. TH24]|uniref:AraC family transcriptional regulator n=1 Tax=Peribacillus sp. TH24 TaxID=2798483 RepID=UPI00191351AC|nr:AraC family transcriptional regulator [Peribacillus sp. TH24]MBK5441637.1 helix-turn-helix transcriptional regulator [Peribacillus sp. TH24]
MQIYNISINSQYQELVQYKDPQWPVIFYHTNIRKNIVGYIPLHWHEELQFVVVTGGHVCFQIHGEEINLNEGEGIFINSGVIHEAQADSCEGRYICWNVGVHLASSYIEKKYIGFLIQNEKVPFIPFSPSINWQNDIMEAIKKGFVAYENKSFGCELVITQQYLFCIERLVTNIVPNHGQKKVVYDPRVKEILRYMHHHYGSKITLDDVANVAYLSRAETNRLFKKHLGRTPFQYLLSYRLDRSKELLVRTTSSITEISLEVGFSSTSYFIEKFKAAFGMTPNKFRLVEKNF